MEREMMASPTQGITDKWLKNYKSKTLESFLKHVKVSKEWMLVQWGD